MGIELSQEAVVYLIIALVVVFVGVGFVAGGDIKNLLFGKNPFAAPTIHVNSISSQAPVATGNTYQIMVNQLSIDYQGPKEHVIEILPILDVGNNPLLATPRTIECRLTDADTFTCPSSASYTFTLDPARLQSDLNGNVYVQLMFFKKADAIVSFATSPSPNSGMTASHLINTYNDFFIYSTSLSPVQFSLRADCPQSTSCSDFGPLQCGQCQWAKEHCELLVGPSVCVAR